MKSALLIRCGQRSYFTLLKDKQPIVEVVSQSLPKEICKDAGGAYKALFLHDCSGNESEGLGEKKRAS